MTSTCCNVAKQPNGQVTRDVDLELTSDQELFRDTTRQFLQAEAPLASVRAWADTPAGFPRAWWKRGAELGWTSLLVSEERGGGSISGQGLCDLALVRRHAKVWFDNVRVPRSAVVGEPGAAADAFERQLRTALILQCAETAGATERVFEFTVQYAFDRYSFGRALASYQALKHR